MKLGILITHPIQYNTPFYKFFTLNSKINLEVLYFSRHGVDQSLDKEFQLITNWNKNLLDGYSYYFIKTFLNKNGIYSKFTFSINLFKVLKN